MNTRSSIPTYDEFQWMCRRGMLELDLVLMSFVDAHYVEWNDQQKSVVRTFLQQDDPYLFDIIITRKKCCDETYQWIVDTIQADRLTVSN